MNKLSEMECFVTVVEAGSISEAGRRLGSAKSVISQRVQQLEQRLGTTLFERGRSIRLTESGEDFYLNCVRILADVSDAEDAVQEVHSRLSGNLRLAIPTSFGMGYLTPIMAGFAAHYPDLRLDLEFDDRHINLFEENFDAIIRIGESGNSSLVSKVLAQNRYVICASPAYLAQHGTPLTPADLPQHFALFCTHRDVHGSWALTVDDRVETFRLRRRMRVNCGLQLLEATKAGLGLAVMPVFLAADALAAGQLCAVLNSYVPRGGNISLLYRRSQRVPLKLEALSNFLTEQIGNPPSWELKLASACSSLHY
jgi:DNA-binding transcriptional LysR family regulator